MKHWRPEGWNNSYRNAFELQGRVDTELEYYGKCFEDGADAILEALRKGGYETSQGDGMRLLFGTDAFIPDDPQPSEKPVIMPGHNENSQPLMICPKAKECGDKCEFPPHTIPHIKDNTGCLANAGISHCPACVPYVPEKETISGWWLNHITGKEEFATINIPPFIKVKIEDNQGYHLQHPASKVIESGYKCSHCGWWVIYGTVHFCPVKRATFFTQSKGTGYVSKGDDR